VANRLSGNDGHNKLDGKGGADTMIGRGGNDTYVVDNAGDKAFELAGEGKDMVVSSVNWTLGAYFEALQLTGSAATGAGNKEANWIAGTDGANTLDGAAGNDTLLGHGGNDRLIGGAGSDMLTGGAGADRFIFASAADAPLSGSRDTIADFSRAEGDRIDLSAIDANGSDAGSGAFKLVSAFDGSHGALVVAAQGTQWLVQGDIDGNRVADFAIFVTSTSALVAADFVL
jgi:Ca2+-binding RTX toxin-like protein